MIRHWRSRWMSAQPGCSGCAMERVDVAAGPRHPSLLPVVGHRQRSAAASSASAHRGGTQQSREAAAIASAIEHLASSARPLQLHTRLPPPTPMTGGCAWLEPHRSGRDDGQALRHALLPEATLHHATAACRRPATTRNMHSAASDNDEHTARRRGERRTQPSAHAYNAHLPAGDLRDSSCRI